MENGVWRSEVRGQKTMISLRENGIKEYGKGKSLIRPSSIFPSPFSLSHTSFSNF